MQIVSTPANSTTRHLISFVAPMDEDTLRMARFVRHLDVVFDGQPREYELLLVGEFTHADAASEASARAENLNARCRLVSPGEQLTTEEALRAAVWRARGATTVVLDRIPVRCSRELSELLRALAVQQAPPRIRGRSCTDENCETSPSSLFRQSSVARSCSR